MMRRQARGSGISGDYPVVSKVDASLRTYRWADAVMNEWLMVDNYAVEGFDNTLGTSP